MPQPTKSRSMKMWTTNIRLSICAPWLDTSTGSQKPYLVSSMRGCPEVLQRGESEAIDCNGPDGEAEIVAAHQSASPARSTAGVNAQKMREAACKGEVFSCVSRRRMARKIASVASTARAAPRSTVQRRIAAVSGAALCMCAGLLARRIVRGQSLYEGAPALRKRSNTPGDGRLSEDRDDVSQRQIERRRVSGRSSTFQTGR